MEIAEAIRRFFSEHENKGRIYIAYSGGIDSHVLLHSLATFASDKDRLRAVYVHHGLQQAADDWQSHCALQAQNLQLNFQAIFVDARAEKGQSQEEAARNARYQALKTLLKENDAVLTGQHAEDQLETVLLQLFRGAGLKGLSGMPEMMKLGRGCLIRPFLNISKQQIVNYAQLYDLQWVEDPSNQAINFDRNYLRNQILPKLKQRWPNLDDTVGRSARICAESQQFLDQAIKTSVSQPVDTEQGCVYIDKLLEQSKFVQKQSIRFWFSQLGLRMPSNQVLQRIIDDMAKSRPDSNPVLHYEGRMFRRYRNRLYSLMPMPPLDTSVVLTWETHNHAIVLPGNGELRTELSNEGGLDKQIWLTAKITVRYRQGGELIKLPGRDGHHSLKKLFQEQSVPPWERQGIPLIYCNDLLAAVGDLWISDEVFNSSKDQNIKIRWCKNYMSKVNDEID